VFPTGAGSVESHGNILSRIFWPIQISAGVVVMKDGVPDAKYSLHALRHACAASGGRALSALADASAGARLGLTRCSSGPDILVLNLPLGRDQAASGRAPEQSVVNETKHN
jgi:hypothetical protein